MEDVGTMSYEFPRDAEISLCRAGQAVEKRRLEVLHAAAVHGGIPCGGHPLDNSYLREPNVSVVEEVHPRLLGLS